MVTAQTTLEVMTVSVGVAMKEMDSIALVMYCINICCTVLEVSVSTQNSSVWHGC